MQETSFWRKNDRESKNTQLKSRYSPDGKNEEFTSIQKVDRSEKIQWFTPFVNSSVLSAGRVLCCNIHLMLIGMEVVGFFSEISLILCR
jgi:hypothetical protein